MAAPDGWATATENTAFARMHCDMHGSGSKKCRCLLLRFVWSDEDAGSVAARRYAFNPSSGRPSMIRRVSTLKVVIRPMRSMMYRGWPCSRDQSLGSLKIPEALSVLTWYRSMIQSSPERDPSM